MLEKHSSAISKSDSHLDQKEMSLKYSLTKAKVLLTAIPGQLPPLPLPTVSFISFLLNEVTRYPKSIQEVSVFLSKLERVIHEFPDWKVV